MNKKDYYDQCEKCGRPMNYAKPCDPCDCEFVDPCLHEYRNSMLACIKRKQQDCLAKAVIPFVTVDTADNLTCLANCFVHVTSNNTTYYIDDKHRIMLVWAGPAEVENYDIEANELKLKSQICYNVNTTAGTWQFLYFDKNGVGHVIKEEV